MGIWLAAYLTIAAAALLQATLLGLQAWEHRRFVRSRATNPQPEGGNARVAIIAPCKGVDDELADNFARLFEQDYPNYEIVFVVESEDDPASSVIETLIRQHPEKAARIEVAGIADGCGQKVHNLQFGVASLSSDVETLVFVDADARPERDWLRQLTRRVVPGGREAASSYRWFVPIRPTLPNLLLASLDHSLIPMSCPGRNYLVWGGSWAITREAFDRVGLMDAWEGQLSDDMVAYRVLRSAGVPVEFEPTAIVASPLDASWQSMFGFLRRQFVVIRWHSPRWWFVGMMLALASQTCFWGALFAAVTLAVAGNVWCLLPASSVTALYSLHMFRSWLRHGASRWFLPRWQKQLRAARLFDLLAHPLAALLNVAGLLASAWGSTLVWRGISYRKESDGMIRVVARPIAPATSKALVLQEAPRPNTVARPRRAA